MLDGRIKARTCDLNNNNHIGFKKSNLLVFYFKVSIELFSITKVMMPLMTMASIENVDCRNNEHSKSKLKVKNFQPSLFCSFLFHPLVYTKICYFDRFKNSHKQRLNRSITNRLKFFTKIERFRSVTYASDLLVDP